MIELHTANTSNGQRVAIMLDECGLPYRTRKYDLFKGEHRTPEFAALNPAGSIPVIVDPDGPGGKPLTLSQSFAILVYLAEKTGRFIPQDPIGRITTFKWLMQAATDVAPASANVFFNTVLMPDKSEANGKWFTERVLKYFGHCDAQLEGRDYLAGEVSVADFALYPVYRVREKLLTEAGGFGGLKAWAARLRDRPGVRKGMSAAE